MNLSGKKILILSPQAWGGMHISKHHYAIELARRGNFVYFLNPPDYALAQYIKIQPHPVVDNLTIVTYRPLLPYFLRFRFRFLFDFLMRFEVERLVKRIGVVWDLLWDFEIYFYFDLSRFNANKVLLHPVDMVAQDRRIEIGKKADVIISVSETILEKFKPIGKPLHWVNHGLAQEFVERAKENNFNYTRPKKVKVGYVGNLFNITIDREVVLILIRKYRDIEFHFAGPFEASQNNLGDNEEESNRFVQTLKVEPNVQLHGVLTTNQLVEFLAKMDLFLVSYFKKDGRYDLSNSHKILEYLSSGKVIVSRHIATYAAYKDLIQMTCEASSNNEFIDLFDRTVVNLDSYNSTSLQKKRVQLALENSYSEQVDRIEKILSITTR